ncbi:MAG: hypothetical protein FJX76_16205 [Armatimonadetes bacterium]|nr:hypothetical protein [Armatimonadota bacterium]
MTELLVGTRKGTFIFRADEARGKWTSDGPHHAGTPVEYVSGRGSGRYASVTDGHFGPHISRSTDGGKTWERLPASPRFEASRGKTVERVWIVEAIGDALYAGVDPATLFVSRDDGVSWEEVRGLGDHPTRDR